MNKLIAVVGMAGSGKSIATDYLENKGWNKIYFGGAVLKKLKEEGLEVTPDNEKMMREKVRKEYGMAAVAIILLDEIKKSVEEKDTVLDGLYSWDEYLVLQKEFKDRLKLICVITDKETRYDRVSKRPVRPFNRDEIIKRDLSEIENLAKGGPIAFSDYYLFNDGSVEDYHKKLEKILEKIEG